MHETTAIAKGLTYYMESASTADNGSQQPTHTPGSGRNKREKLPMAPRHQLMPQSVIIQQHPPVSEQLGSARCEVRVMHVTNQHGSAATPSFPFSRSLEPRW